MDQQAPFAFDEAGIDLEARAEQALTRASKRGRIGDPFVEMDHKLDAALATVETIEAKKIVTREIRNTIKEVMDDFKADEADLGDVVASLHALAEEAGSQIADLETLHPKAKQIIADAETEHTNAQEAVTTAASELAVANAKSRAVAWLNGRNEAIADAESALTKAKNRLETAKTALEEAPAKANRMHREILMNETMEEKNLHIRAMHERANDILDRNIDDAKTALERREQVISASRARHKAAIDEHDQTTKEHEAQQRKVADLEARLGELERNTPDYASLDAELSLAREEQGKLKAKIDAATGEAQELEEKLQTLELQRDALITLKGNYERSLRIGIAAAKLNAEVSAVRIEIIKGMSDLEIQNDLLGVSRQDTIRAAEGAAGAIHAVERMRVTYGKQHPEVMRAQRRIRDALDGHLAILNEEDRQLLEAWRNDVFAGGGDDPSPPKTESSKGRQEEFTL